MKNKIVKIEWVDSARSFDWSLLEEIDNKPVNCISVGFLIENTKEHITIAQNYGFKPEQVCNLITIPKCSVKNIKKLKEE